MCVIQQVIQIYLTNAAITSLYCGMCVRMGVGIGKLTPTLIASSLRPAGPL